MGTNRARAQLKENKTITHVKLFCRCYVEEALALSADLFPNMVGVLTEDEDEEDEKNLPREEGRDYLKYIMAEQGFNNFLRGRANDDMIRLELLQGGIAALRAGGFDRGAHG